MIPHSQQAYGIYNSNTLKRKIGTTTTMEATTIDNSSQTNTMSCLDYKDIQQQ